VDTEGKMDGACSWLLGPPSANINVLKSEFYLNNIQIIRYCLTEKYSVSITKPTGK
jgi:hypothetical protein